MKKIFLVALGIAFSAATFAQKPAGAKAADAKTGKAEVVKVKADKKSGKSEVKADKKVIKPAAKHM